MLKLCIIFSALCLLTIGCYVMLKPDLSDLGIIPVVATNPETASEFRSLFAGSFIAYAYLLIRFAYSYKPISIEGIWNKKIYFHNRLLSQPPEVYILTAFFKF